MAQFVAFDPNVKVSGQSMLITTEAMGERALPILRQHGLAPIHPDRWYAQQAYLDFFRDVASGDLGAMFDLVAIGTKVPELAFWPPEIQTVEDALASIGQAYDMNHQGGDIGYYQAESTGERQVTMECCNPYPDDFDYGLIYGVARKYLPPDGNLTVVHDDDAPCRKAGADSCTYHVSW